MKISIDAYSKIAKSRSSNNSYSISNGMLPSLEWFLPTANSYSGMDLVKIMS